jgi:hypothetical protein
MKTTQIHFIVPPDPCTLAAEYEDKMVKRIAKLVIDEVTKNKDKEV